MEQSKFIALTEEILEVEPGTVGVDDVLEEIDWDSLANIGLIAEIDTRFGVALDAERLGNATTIADLHSLVEDSIEAS